MADTAHRLTDEKLEEMEKRLSAIYSRAEKEIQKTADDYFSKFAKQDEAKRKLLEQGKITEDEYKKWCKGKVLYGKRFTEMKKQCAKQLLNVNQTALAYVNGELPEVYAVNYNALAGSVDGVGGYSFTLVDADTVRNLAVTDTSLLPYKEIDPKKDIPWNMKKINAETLQGILQGESMDKIAKRLRNVQEMNKTQAIRSARTIVTGAENKGRQDSYARAEADGIILQKEWIATNDNRTRHAHSHLDGVIVDQDKPFETVLWLSKNKRMPDKIMFPGDPSAHPANVYNCRCTLVAKVNGFKKVQVQKAMAEKQEQMQEQTIKKPEDYTDSASVDKRLAELEKQMEESLDPNEWFRIGTEEEALRKRKEVLLRQESRARAQETQRRIYEKDYFATKGMGKGYAVDLDGLDEKSMLDVERAMDSVFEKFPSLKNKFSGISVVDDLPEGAMAACGRSFGEVSLSRSYFGKNSNISAAWQRCVESGLHPSGTSSYAAIVHEFGHSVDHIITRKGDMFDPKYIGKDATASTVIKKRVYKKLGISDGDVASGLSSYATMNDKEFVAEAFAEYVTSPTPRPIAGAVGEEIEKMLGGLF
jgi:SPP1 gp7 family putative phage head morphogenesis protein